MKPKISWDVTGYIANNMIIGLSKSCGFHPIYNHFDRENDEQSLEPGWLAEACSTIKIC